MIGDEDRFATNAVSRWPKITLREANITLIDCDHRTPPASQVGYPYVAIPQLKKGRIDLTDVRRIASEYYRDWTLKAKPYANDVILSRRCNPGETAVVPPNLEFALGQNLVLLRADGTRIYPPFLRWLVRSPEWWEQIQKYLNVGAVFDSLKCADVPNFELSIPPLPAQRRIAHILGSLDDKIELNRQMNETLEAMARAIFKSWFVDFDPVRAKAEGRQPAGMDAETAALFPDDFEEVEGREVPRGWRIQSINECVQDIFDYRGKTPKKLNDEWSPYGIIAISAKNIKNGELINLETVKFVSEDLYKKWMKSDLEEGDILLTSEAPLGELFYLAKSRKLCLSQRLYCIRADRKIIEPTILYLSLNTPIVQFELISRETGTTVTGIRQSLLRTVPILVPPFVIQKKIAPIFSSLLLKISLNNEQSDTLTQIRDILLPKLMSGEIRVG
ncbi:MAG: restriction endonuclease subunit S [Methanomicrobiales archaeon]